MITLHRKPKDPSSVELEEKLNDLVIAFETEDHAGADNGMPYIEESGNKIEGKEAIEDWLKTLQDELQWQRSLSGDGCYIDPKSGETC
ncbi:MAG: hypothetical protein WD491_15125 [Balneolales bacterium]